MMMMMVTTTRKNNMSPRQLTTILRRLLFLILTIIASIDNDVLGFRAPSLPLFKALRHISSSNSNNKLIKEQQQQQQQSSSYCTTTTSKNTNIINNKQQQQQDVSSTTTILHADDDAHDDPWDYANLQECFDLWDLSQDEQADLMIMKDKIKDIDHPKNNPFDVIRFLKQYDDDDLKVAEHKFRNMINWRINNDVDSYLVQEGRNQYQPPSVYKYFPAATLKGLDKDGDPIHIERTGIADTLGLLERHGKDEMLKFSIWIREVACSSSNNSKWQLQYEQEQHHKVKQFTLIFDMKGLTATKVMSPSIMSIGQQVTHIVQEYYPYYAKRIIFIRTPSIFQFAWKMFRPFVDKKIQDLVIFAGENDYHEVLESYMDINVLPSVIVDNNNSTNGGGEALDEFGDIIWEGGKIPSSSSLLASALLASTAAAEKTSNNNNNTTSTTTDNNEGTTRKQSLQPRQKVVVDHQQQDKDEKKKKKKKNLIHRFKQNLIPNIVNWILCRETDHHDQHHHHHQQHHPHERKRYGPGQYTVYRPLL